MDKVAILTASRVEPNVSIPAAAQSNVIAVLGPTLRYAIQLQNILSSASVVIYFHAHYIAGVALAGTWYASKVIAAHAFLASRIGAGHTLAMSRTAVSRTLSSKRWQMLRKRCFEEIASFVFGTGNPILLLVFWPGWLLVGAGVATWRLWG